MVAKKVIVKRVFSAIWWVLVALLAILVVSIVSAKAKGKVPKIFGYSVVHIVSGSMETEIPVGSYILIKECSPAEVKKGDVICFYSDDPVIYGLPNTHRVHEDPVKGENGWEFVTKGDANPVKDAYTAKGDKLVGKYVGKVDALTWLSDALEGNGMMIMLILMQGGVFIIIFCTIFKKKDEAGEDATPKTEGEQIAKEQGQVCVEDPTPVETSAQGEDTPPREE